MLHEQDHCSRILRKGTQSVGCNYLFMIEKMIFCLLLFLPTTSSSQSAYLSEIIGLRDSIKYIDIHEFKYNRPYPYLPNRQVALGKILILLESLPNEEIQTLLTNENPRSRALGILALYQVNNQNALLQLLQYFSDSSACY